jgi:hypothetical protein
MRHRMAALCFTRLQRLGFFEIAFVPMHLDQLAGFIVNLDHSIM